jgi:hypothetical protein
MAWKGRTDSFWALLDFYFFSPLRTRFCRDRGGPSEGASGQKQRIEC